MVFVEDVDANHGILVVWLMRLFNFIVALNLQAFENKRKINKKFDPTDRHGTSGKVRNQYETKKERKQERKKQQQQT